MDQDYADGFNAFHNDEPRDDQRPLQWLNGYDHAEGGGLLRCTDWINDR